MNFDHTDKRWVDEAVHLVGHDPGWARKFDAVATTPEPVLRPWLAGVASLKDRLPCIDLPREAGWW